MSSKSARVSEGWVYDPAVPDSEIQLDTPAWFAWLETEHTRQFSYPLFDPVCGYIVGFMTVRKERRVRGGNYWSVFRRAGRQVRKCYLGRSEKLTQSRLAAIAEALRTEQTASGRTQAGNDADTSH
jgi:LuxR family maltose regulon positive regulatory protein